MVVEHVHYGLGGMHEESGDREYECWGHIKMGYESKKNSKSW